MGEVYRVSEGFVERVRARQGFHLGMDCAITRVILLKLNKNFISKWIVKNFRTKGDFHSEMDLEKGDFL